MNRPILCALSILFILGFSCQPSQPQDDTQLGRLGHQFTGSAEAQPHFEEGMLFLHSFQYEDAREAFQKAKEADPRMVMAYWGEAMSHYKALWGRENVEEARKVMLELGDSEEARLAQAPDPLEKGFLECAEILFGDKPKEERHQAYAEAMENLYARFPRNQEVATFYSLSLLWTQDNQELEKSARVVQSVLQENPEHPGALHYMIHAYDNPEFAPRALDAAQAYGKVAPSAAHALHMPSHIYVAMGMWDEVVEANERAYAASVERMKRKELGNDERDLHSYQWLMYGYLQQGRYAEAEKIMLDVIDMYPTLEYRNYANEYMARMVGAYLIESGDWENEAVVQAPFDGSDIGLRMRSMHQYPMAFLAYRKKDAESLAAIGRELAESIADAEVLISDDGPAMCSAPGLSRYAPTENGVLSAQVVLAEIQALEAMLANDPAAAEAHLKQAVAWEMETEYSYGPPQILKPSTELYGEWLLEQGRADEALLQFDKALERAPRRVISLRGKMRVYDRLGMTEESIGQRQEIESIWHRADPEVVESLLRDDLLSFR
jgi:tetratricopeptide (TPR) repeat protein